MKLDIEQVTASLDEFVDKASFRDVKNDVKDIRSAVMEQLDNEVTNIEVKYQRQIDRLRTEIQDQLDPLTEGNFVTRVEALE